MTKKELWVEQKRFYNELIDKYNWDIKPMLDIIEILENAGICKKFYPSNSHESLCLSLYQSSEDRFENPRVLIKYDSYKKSFAVEYYNEKSKKYTDDINDTQKLKIGKIEAWLLI